MCLPFSVCFVFCFLCFVFCDYLNCFLTSNAPLWDHYRSLSLHTPGRRTTRGCSRITSGMATQGCKYAPEQEHEGQYKHAASRTSRLLGNAKIYIAERRGLAHTMQEDALSTPTKKRGASCFEFEEDRRETKKRAFAKPRVKQCHRKNKSKK